MPVGKYPVQLTYWAPAAYNDYGVASFVAPVKVLGRWEDRAEMFRTPKGDEVTSAAVVFCSKAISPDGYLAHGDFATVPIADPHNASVIPPAVEIRQVASTRNIRYSDQEIRAYL